ncbi:hypothetical protein JCM8097_002079 [Rhodosporidiobolus ruineniae]
MAALVITDAANKLSAKRKLGDTLPAGVDPRAPFSTVRVHDSLYSTWRREREEAGRWVRAYRTDDSTREAKRQRRRKENAAKGKTTIPRVTRRAEFEWSERLVCDHSGQPDKRVLAAADPNRQRQSLKNSIKVGCKATFFARKRYGDAYVEIMVQHDHSGHKPGTIDDMKESRMSLQAREWLRALVAQGSSWPMIKALLRVDKDELDNVSSHLSTITSISESWRVSYQDAYNHIRRAVLAATRLAPDSRRSTELWIERLRRQDWRAELIESRDATGGEAWALCLMSPWQEAILEADGGILCMDSTHNTSFALDKYNKSFLYTLVAKNQVTGQGIPVAFMVTPSETHEELPTFRPRFIMVDCSVTEAAAVREWLKDEDDERPKPVLLWCHYHLFKAVRSQAIHLLGGIEAGTQGFSEFMKLVSAPTIPAFDAAWSAFRQEYRRKPEWLHYMETYCIRVKERWACAWRDLLLFDIHTNNLIEAWHRDLKVNYLGMMRKQRVDFLIHVLAECVLPDYQRHFLRVKLGFGRRSLDKAEKKRRAEVWAVPSDLAPEMCYQNAHGEYFIESFQTSHSRYAITLDPSSSISGCSCPDFTNKRVITLDPSSSISGCSCPDFTNKRVICKHILHPPRTFCPAAPSSPSTGTGTMGSPQRDDRAQQDDDAGARAAEELRAVESAERARQQDGHLAVLTQVRSKEAELRALVQANYGGLDAGPVDLTVEAVRALEDVHSYLSSAVLSIKGGGLPLYATQR